MYRYFILNLPYEYLDRVLDICLNKQQPQRYNLDKTKLLIMTTTKVINDYLKNNKDVTFDILFPPELCDECADYNHALQVTSGDGWAIPFDVIKNM